MKLKTIDVSKGIDFKLLGHGAFLVLFFLAVFFYLERTLYVDTNYMAFNLLYYKDFFCSGQRYASQIPQVLPLLAIGFHLPLKVVLALFSVSFILLYYLVFLIIAYVFKDDKLALAVPLVVLLGVKYSFFWTVTETHQALAYTVLLISFLNYSQKMRPGTKIFLLKLMIATGIIFLCFFSHPVAFFPVLFILGYFLIDQKLWKKSFVYILTAILVAMMIIKVFIVPANPYDSEIYCEFFSVFDRISHLQKSESLLFFYNEIFNIYLFSLIIFIVTCSFYIGKKQYFKLTFYLVSIIGFLLVIFLTFTKWYYPFIQEKNIVPLNILLLIPFINEVVFSSNRLNIIKQIFLVLLFAVSVAHVIIASGFYTNRLAYLRDLITMTKQFPEKKFIIDKKYIDINQVNVLWAFATESLLLSSLDGPDSSRSIYIPNHVEEIKTKVNLKDPTLFICVPWYRHLIAGKMDKHYFNLENSAYRIISLNDFYTKNRTIIYTNNFDQQLKKINKNYDRDSSGNSRYVLTSEFGPGMTKKLSQLTNQKSILLTAIVKVLPREEVGFRSLMLVISKEQGGVISNYFNSYGTEPYILKPGTWATLTVSGVLNNTDIKDKIKVYLWNPEKKKFLLDDYVIYFTTR